MKAIKLLIFNIVIFVFASWMSVWALEEVKNSRDKKEVLEEIKKTAEDDLKKVRGKIGEIEVKKGTLTLEELEPLAPLDPLPHRSTSASR